MSFEGSSTSSFVNNSASSGGAISYWLCDGVNFNKNSATIYSNNIAIRKSGAIYSESSNVSFIGNSSTIFTENSALSGGAIHGCCEVTMTFEGFSVKGFSVTVFKSNVASFGGAIYMHKYISLILSHNSTVRFANNKATVGATVYSDSIKVLQHSSVVINGQSAKWCKDACIQKLI